MSDGLTHEKTICFDEFFLHINQKEIEDKDTNMEIRNKILIGRRYKNGYSKYVDIVPKDNTTDALQIIKLREKIYNYFENPKSNT